VFCNFIHRVVNKESHLMLQQMSWNGKDYHKLLLEIICFYEETLCVQSFFKYYVRAIHSTNICW
jgi:hypothetical protein